MKPDWESERRYRNRGHGNRQYPCRPRAQHNPAGDDGNDFVRRVSAKQARLIPFFRGSHASSVLAIASCDRELLSVRSKNVCRRRAGGVYDFNTPTQSHEHRRARLGEGTTYLVAMVTSAIQKHENKIQKIVTSRFLFASAFTFALFSCLTTARADETCSSPYLARIDGQEEFVYVWTLGVEGLATARTNSSSWM